MDVQAAAGLARRDLRGEGDVDAQPLAQRAEDPLGHHQLVGGLLGVGGQKLDLVLLVEAVGGREVAHLRVAVLDAAARRGDVLHGQLAECRTLVEGGRLVVAPLVGGREEVAARRDHVVLQLAHHVQVESRALAQHAAGLAQRLLGSHLQRRALLGVVAAQDVKGGNLAEGVAEGRAVARHDVEVAGPGLDIGEEARPVDPLAAREDAGEVLLVLDDEIERLQPPVGARVAEVDHLDPVFAHVAHQVGFGKLALRLAEEAHQRIGIQIGIHGGRWL